MISLRRVRPDDAAVRSELVGRNLDSFRMWMPWARDEPLDVDAERDLLRGWDEAWETGAERHHFIVENGADVGMVGLVHRDRSNTVEVGYWLDAAARGRGVMTAAVELAVDLAFEDDAVDEVQIHHDRANAASRGVPFRLGFRFVDDRYRAPAASADTGREWAWSMTRRRWENRVAMDAVVIRPMSEGERGEVIELWRAGDLVRAWNDPELDLDRKLAHSPDGLRVAVLDGAPVGTAMVGYDGHRGWINYLTVDPFWRGRGIGARLVIDAEVWLAVQGCPKINLQVRTANTEALDVYRGLGYEPVDATDLGRRLVVDDESDDGSTDC